MRDSTVQNCHQNNSGAVEAGAPSVEKDLASSVKAATEVPPSSFQFYVWSDVGINLHVDLNLSSSDWINRFRNEVCISENMHRNKSRSLWQDLSSLGENYMQGKSSFLWSKNSCQIEDHDGQARSSSSSKLTKDGATESGQQNKDGIPLRCDSFTPCNMTIEVKDNILENHSTVSAELNVNVVDNLMQEQSTVSAEVSCAIDTSKKIIDSDATNMPFIKSLCDSVVNSLSDPGTLELQNSKPDNECSEYCALLNGSCFVNPGVVCAGASLSSSVGLQNSEVISCHKYESVSLCDNDGSLDLSDPKSTSDMEQDRLVKTRIIFETDSNNFTSVTDEWEVDKIVDGRESSECSQFDDPLKKSSLDYNNQDSKLELCKKRKNRDSEIQCSNGEPTTTRVLRSMKNTATRVLRSMKNVKLPR
ncbi:hypothetical protein JHK82_032864 [Glycine max]|uniref:Uncharacterized protein n=1 Tax=Glycine max TaxID=3847 RepID=K7LT60_SOYBN|nr:uncharacterized protein LOC100779750 [Glycine max]XP_040863322.1 uncharacterized protein LOC100779750 [Glycine max]XP_040863323.1 uncharacterized protein LOC100779750 [Glycine max]KAG4979611.1 hypothetical protein JHK85_033569 [Glycine max]KAG4985259.1 hypothetical protein JHK86_032950 [Glycine max]KAG5118444.1 hypothetical protein JHK82_032864 [Glycine max]KAH1141715.1 hypothetical protein GYH30_032766 [Glycine max]KAH1220233.1 hypothetical protein GmHk_12G033946 [Glycine max]|eukprot:XP_006592148.1 uncharacterized protein LOC100779750 [Glycine max]